MEDARQIRQRFESVMERMGQAVRLIDQRVEPAESLHRGFRTKGSGPEAAWEFRFLEAPEGLQVGGILSLEGEEGRWRVEEVRSERHGTELLFVSARVADLESIQAPLAQDLAGLLQILQDLLGRSTLAPLEEDDVEEAVERLILLSAAPASPEAAHRIRSRLRLLDERFKACPQTSHEAKGTLLKLEALLKRKGQL